MLVVFRGLSLVFAPLARVQKQASSSQARAKEAASMPWQVYTYTRIQLAIPVSKVHPTSSAFHMPSQRPTASFVSAHPSRAGSSEQGKGRMMSAHHLLRTGGEGERHLNISTDGLPAHLLRAGSSAQGNLHLPDQSHKPKRKVADHLGDRRPASLEAFNPCPPYPGRVVYAPTAWVPLLAIG